MAESIVLIINTGSSSIKMALIHMPSEQLIAEGSAERLGESEALLRWKGVAEVQYALAGVTHFAAMQQMLDVLFQQVDRTTVSGVGHRVVHGGERFVRPTLLDVLVIAEIASLSHLAPLHNPSNLLGIKAAMDQLPDIPHVAVFDTAFHHAMPLHASLYAVPYEWYSEYGVRRYGFHGTSHHYVSQQAARILDLELEPCNLITVHLGNGCSAAAVSDGVSVDTTMGMTPLEGLVMGTRSGDVDPGLHEYMASQSGDSLAAITDALNRKSGLLGLSGRSNDMRTLLDAAEAGDERAVLAIDLFCYRLVKSLAGLAAVLGHVDAIVFTGGIGEHAQQIRAKTVRQLAILGADIDTDRNARHGKLTDGFISKSETALPVLVIATNEETMIARYVHELLFSERGDS